MFTVTAANAVGTGTPSPQPAGHPVPAIGRRTPRWQVTAQPGDGTARGCPGRTPGGWRQPDHRLHRRGLPRRGHRRPPPGRPPPRSPASPRRRRHVHGHRDQTAVGTGAASDPSPAVTPAADRLRPGQQLAPGSSWCRRTGSTASCSSPTGTPSSTARGSDRCGTPGRGATPARVWAAARRQRGRPCRAGARWWHSGTWGNPG